MKKRKKLDILDILLILVSIIWIYITFFLYRADGTVVQPYPNEADYPVYSGKNVYEYWKTTLSENEQILYEELKESYLQFNKSFSTQLDRLTSDELEKVNGAVKKDHPEIFWLSSYSYTSKKDKTEVNTKKTIRLFFNYDLEEAKKVKQEIEPNYMAIIQKAQELESDWDKIKLVHDQLIELGDYHIYPKEEMDDYQSIVTIFRDGKTVCSGYSYGFKFLMDYLGIESMVCRDISHDDDPIQNHIWNLVKYDRTMV